MEEAHQIVLQALEQAGVGIPAGVDSVQDLSPLALVAMCRGALALIEGASFAEPPPFPVSMAERFRICSELASSIKNLGFKGDLSFHQFLYPSEEESYKVLHFLLDKLSKSSGDASGSRKGCSNRFANESIGNSKTFAIAREAFSCWPEDANKNISSGTSKGVVTEDLTSVPFRTCPLRVASINGAPGRKTTPLITLQAKPASSLIPSVLELNVKNALMSTALLHGQLSHLALEARNVQTGEMGDVKAIGRSLLQDLNISSYLDVESSSLSRETTFSKEKDMILLRERIGSGDGEGKAQDEESASSFSGGHVDLGQRELTVLEQRLRIVSVDNLKLTRETIEFKEGINKLEVNREVSSKELEVLKKKHDSMKIASEIVLDSTQTEELKMLRLKTARKESQQRLADSKLQWESVYTELERKKSCLELSPLTEDEEIQSKLQELKSVRQQIRDTTIKLKQREEQLNGLTAELENSMKGPLRSTYVGRITELIKNSKKQDTDISRIIGETCDLQRESNANQGRLKRTHALVDELVFRDAKKDPVCRQAYRLLTSIHEDFSDCYDKVFSMDKVRREITELQATLETMEKRPVDLQKIQADFDALVAENLSLEKSLQAAQASGDMQVK